MQTTDIRNTTAFAGYGVEDSTLASAAVKLSGGIERPAMSGKPTALTVDKDIEEFNGNAAVKDIYALLTLFSITAQRTRTACRDMRQTELDAFQVAAESAADAIREASRQRFIGSVLGGAASCVSGIAQMGIGAKGLRQNSQAAKLQTDATAATQRANAEMKFAAEAELKFAAGTPEAAIANVHRAKAEQFNQNASKLMSDAQTLTAKSYSIPLLGNGVSSLVTGAAQIGKGGFDWRAADEDAKRMVFETQSRICENRMQAEERVMQDRHAEMQDLREKLNAIAQSRLETNRTVARNL
jgi:hypothetical protein